MDFFGRVFGSAFFGHDFSVIVFWVVWVALALTLATLVLCICANLSDGVKTPRWGKVVTISVALSIAALTGVSFTQ